MGTELGSILVLAEKAVDWIYEKGKEPVAQPTPDVNDKIVEAMVRAAEDSGIAAQADAIAGPKTGRVVTRVESMAVKTVNDGKGKRFRVHTSGDEDYYTFSETLAQILKKAKDQKQMVSLTFVARDFGQEITEAQTVQGTTIDGDEVVIQ